MEGDRSECCMQRQTVCYLVVIRMGHSQPDLFTGKLLAITPSPAVFHELKLVEVPETAVWLAQLFSGAVSNDRIM